MRGQGRMVTSVALAAVWCLACASKDDGGGGPDPVGEAGDAGDESGDESGGGTGDGAGDETGDAGEALVEPEPCTSVSADRPCGETGDQRQFCDWLTVADELVLAWGECLDPECLPGEQRECLVGEVNCTVEEGVPYWPDCGFTPLVLRFEPGPVELAASAGAFDLAGVGQCLDTDWPAPANPWLAIDLDRSGAIDGGHELLGAATALPGGGRARHGFEALAALDHDHDGDVDLDDPGFARLLVWRDHDGDKRSSGLELAALADEGVTRLELAFVTAERCDARGNCARERAAFEYRVAGERRVGELVDVHLACD